jgi:hypothetical protein
VPVTVTVAAVVDVEAALVGMGAVLVVVPLFDLAGVDPVVVLVEHAARMHTAKSERTCFLGAFPSREVFPIVLYSPGLRPPVCQADVRHLL